MGMRIRTLAVTAALAPAVLAAMPLLAVIARSGAGAASATPASIGGIPAVLLQAYNQAAIRTPAIDPGCTGMRWSILAAIGMTESSQAAGHQITPDGEVTPPVYGVPLDGSGTGGNTTPVYNDGGYARALGPMQILPSTWARWAQWGRPGDGTPDPQNVFDAALTTAAILCGGGRRNLADPAQLTAAILSYNDSETYVAEVESWITTYNQMAMAGGPTSDRPPGSVAAKVIAFAEAQLGKPYLWGGTGPGAFDCSGLTMMAYRAAGFTIPRTSEDQWTFGQQIPASQVQPGDLVFFAGSDGTMSAPGHVGVVIGGGMMIDAPYTGVDIREDSYLHAPDLVGFTRPNM
jgi:cell wall-associated NlpC family hydrolase